MMHCLLKNALVVHAAAAVMFDLFVVHAFERYMYGTLTLIICRRHTGVVTVAWHRKASGGMSCVCCACGGAGPSSLMTSSMVFRSVIA